ncbi:LacI family DNA-binding transcriptional regulator [Mesorhizobium sp. M7A.F.Ca.CA.001.07.2.1]|uniref:LacI family DNA-binding transcriptional regulator n=4 Tax=Phyllobacteriaceae TaxID=69277 RepID=UPI000FCA8389|nr:MULTISPECIES: LacI family DNA-binding transcriptional regulator [Mesorhizobium]MCF6127233.1 LacI family DNA-binding transcriptional regulator [Mesorhizobium ciceri]MCQ8817584.1 LacI family DNA-binding transcriptional regulator [Mesorhizobium sp. SEMIA396]RUX81474.1 LacI family DNA-binding transcriptional regulator [Mesorhizobium sp. M7A.F.Ca.CA.004.08.2.1]RUX86030.1 LacI family DNA-binding transcriptional regulator [Mesorhizobium sp. M7A.F.Ca.CA.004.08.1.1]RUY03689.1 LacI family DNA-binding
MSVIARNKNSKPRLTVKDLARDLGMSVSTVSRAFHADAVIAKGTRDVVLNRAREIGYSPNPFARSLITKKTRIVGVVVADIKNPFYPEVLTRLTTELRAIDMNVMLVAADQSGEVDQALRLLLNYQPDLAIILAATLSSEAAQECRNAGTPVIFFNRLSADDHAFGISCDNILGGRSIADYLADTGHRRLAYIAALADASTNVARHRGFSERAVERGLAVPAVIDAGQFSYHAGYEAACKLRDLEEMPDGVFCANDILAIGFLDGVRELGLNVPDDLSIVGFDDIEMAHWPSHGLTTVKQPIEKMLEATISLAKELGTNAGREPVVQMIAPGAVIERATTRRRHHD